MQCRGRNLSNNATVSNRRDMIPSPSKGGSDRSKEGKKDAKDKKKAEGAEEKKKAEDGGNEASSGNG